MTKKVKNYKAIQANEKQSNRQYINQNCYPADLLNANYT